MPRVKHRSADNANFNDRIRPSSTLTKRTPALKCYCFTFNTIPARHKAPLPLTRALELGVTDVRQPAVLEAERRAAHGVTLTLGAVPAAQPGQVAVADEPVVGQLHREQVAQSGEHALRQRRQQVTVQSSGGR